MNIEEARKVLWLRNNHRPLGELLDEGFLTRSRLEWAAKKAYDANLRQAAQVILDSLKQAAPPARTEARETVAQVEKDERSVPIEIPAEKARKMPWPFPPYKGQPMGELVESKQLSLKDLGYAIENAWDKNVKKAATALLLVRLEQSVKEPDPPAGFVKVISGGRSYSERKQSWLTWLDGAVFGVIVALLIASAIWWSVYTFSHQRDSELMSEILLTPLGILALGIILGFMGFILWLVNFIPAQISKRLEKQIEAYRRGEEGEERAVQRIVQALDGNWTLFRNVYLPGQSKADLDIVLVGPPGVWVLEVKNLSGMYRNIGETWEYRHKKNWKIADINPSRQAQQNAYRMGNFLKADHLNVFVNAAVVWANEETQPVIENPVAAVWFYHQLADELGNIWQAEKLSDTERKKIIEKFDKLCQAQKEKNAKCRG